MRILVIDGQGGGIGKTLVERICGQFPEDELIAVGTNSTATTSMRRAGAVQAATGENAMCYNSARADVIVGPMGIVLANAMLGEITPAAAAAVAQSEAKKLLIPVSRCQTQVVGVVQKPLTQYIEDVLAELQKLKNNSASL